MAFCRLIGRPGGRPSIRGPGRGGEKPRRDRRESTIAGEIGLRRQQTARPAAGRCGSFQVDLIVLYSRVVDRGGRARSVDAGQAP